MKVGDLVRMKTMMFWAAKNNPRINYTETPGIVIKGNGPNNPYAMISVLISNKIYRGLASEWELVSEQG